MSSMDKTVINIFMAFYASRRPSVQAIWQMIRNWASAVFLESGANYTSRIHQQEYKNRKAALFFYSN